MRSRSSAAMTRCSHSNVDDRMPPYRDLSGSASVSPAAGRGLATATVRHRNLRPCCAGKLRDVPKRAATVKLDADVLSAIRLEAARSGRSEDQVVEDAVRRYIGPSVLDHVRERNHLDDDEAMKIAAEEIAAHRRERRGGR